MRFAILCAFALIGAYAAAAVAIEHVRKKNVLNVSSHTADMLALGAAAAIVLLLIA